MAESQVSSSPSSVAGGVPSIIIQDSFVIEQPSLSPTSSPPLNKSNSSAAVPVPKTRSNKNHEIAAEVADFPTVIPQPRQRKELATVEESPRHEAISIQSAGEDAEAEFDTGQSLSAPPRMSPSQPSPSFPVNVDEHLARPPPVPKPRRSPVPPPIIENSVLSIEVRQDEPTPADHQEFKTSIQLNPFDSDSFSEPDSDTERLDHTYNVEDAVDRIDETALDEDGVCQMLEKVIEEHDHQQSMIMNADPPPKPARTAANVVELYNDDENDDKVVDESRVEESLATTIDIFEHPTMNISPVERVGSTPDANISGLEDDTPVTQSVRKTRLFSLFSTPTSETDPEQRSNSVVHLDWLEDSDDVNGSQGFGGSEHLSSGLTFGSTYDSAKTMDSAVSVTDNNILDSSPVDPALQAELLEARNRPLDFILPPPLDVDFTPPLPSAQSASSGQSVASNKGELLWDNYDIQITPTSTAEVSEFKGFRRSIVPEVEPDRDAIARRKRVSLAPSLKTMALNTPSSDQSTGSPITEDDEDDNGEQAGKQNPLQSILAVILDTFSLTKSHIIIFLFPLSLPTLYLPA